MQCTLCVPVQSIVDRILSCLYYSQNGIFCFILWMLFIPKLFHTFSQQNTLSTAPSAQFTEYEHNCLWSPSSKYWCRRIFFFTNLYCVERRKTTWMLVLLSKLYIFKISERNVIISICLWKKYFICFDLITKIFHYADRKNVLFHCSDGRNTSISMFWFTGAGCYI